MMARRVKWVTKHLGFAVGDAFCPLFMALSAPLVAGEWKAPFADNGQSLGSSGDGQVAFGDLDSDGDLDALVGSGLMGSGDGKLWLNDGQGTFTAVSQDLSDLISFDMGDVDGDGDLDAFSFYLDTGTSCTVWLNDGSGTFTAVLQTVPYTISASGALGDLDGDGDLDAFVVQQDDSTTRPYLVWLNDGSGAFTDSGQRLGGGSGGGVALGDLDRDGDLDAFVANRAKTAGGFPMPMIRFIRLKST